MQLEPLTSATLSPTQSSNNKIIPKSGTSDDTYGGKPDGDDVAKSNSHHTMVQ